MVKHTQTIRRLLATNCLSVFGHFLGLALKRLKLGKSQNWVETEPSAKLSLQKKIFDNSVQKLRKKDNNTNILPDTVIDFFLTSSSFSKWLIPI